MDKYKYFGGLKFTRDEKTGYYLNSTNNKRLHRYVWEYYYGEIPEGYHVHHIDRDKNNNDINNLTLLNANEHTSMHSTERGLFHYEEMIDNLNRNARPKASEWHGSKEGKEWHKKQYKYLKEWQENKVEKKCKQCGTSFETINTKSPKFCSNKCKSKWRRESGVDDVTRECSYCGEVFTINKYSKTKHCSRSCTKSSYWHK